MSGMLKLKGLEIGGSSGETSTCKCPEVRQEMDSWPVWLGAERAGRSAGELEEGRG